MKYAVIAAGEGSRLSQEGVNEPKPLIMVGGERLIDRLIRIFTANDADEIWVICNDKTSAVSHHLMMLRENGLDGRTVPLHYVVKTTPSSMHSFYELRNELRDQPFVLTTVDTIFREDDFSAYIRAFRSALSSGMDGLMGVTDFIDDERPLYIETDSQRIITGFVDERPADAKYISGGIYGLTPKAVDVLERCVAEGNSRMRNFQRALIDAHFRLAAWQFSKIMDVDHKTDIAKAEAFLRNGRN